MAKKSKNRVYGQSGGVNMENQEIVIKGTIDGIIKVLKKDFDMPDDEAKYFVYIMISRHNKDAVNTISKDELDIWYLSDQDKYTGQILNTHLFINFTLVEKELQHIVYTFFVQFIFSRNIDLVLIGAELAYVIIAAVSKIEDRDYCVFSRIIELCVENNDRSFSINDIQTQNKDGKCDYQNGDKKCVYMGKYEDCTCNKGEIGLSFQNLENKNIIRKIGDRWMLVR